jgi:hypothetical protein
MGKNIPKTTETKVQPKKGIIFDDDDEGDATFNKNSKIVPNILNKPTNIINTGI